MTEIEHAYAFDPAYGYTLDRLLAIRPPDEPDDAETFWQETYAETLDLPLAIDIENLRSPREDFAIRLVRFNGRDGVRLGGWLVEPVGRAAERFVVHGHGYYNRPIEDVRFDDSAVTFCFACRGLGASRTPGLSDQTPLHVLHGIESKETYVHRGCVADTWSAGSVMLTLFPQAAGRLEYLGQSFGGGIGAMALAWDRRFVFGDLSVPSFGHQPIRLGCPCTGSGEAVRRKWQRHPEIYDRTLRYFDAAIHARRLAMPVAFACALFDPAVPPPGQFAVYNAATCKKKLCVLRTGHHAWPGTEADERRAAGEARRFGELARANSRAKARLTAGVGVA